MKIAVVILSIAVALLAVLLGMLYSKYRAMKKEQALLRDERDEAVSERETEERFVHNLSHEVRTPLNAVVGFAQLLSLPPECLTEQERTEYSEHVMHNSNMLIMLVDDILNVSDIRSGKYTITPSMQQLNAICQVVIQAVKYRLADGVELNYETELPADYAFMCDARRVQQIVINLLTNALKHTSEGRVTLRTSLSEDGGMLTFAVADTGDGIPEGKEEEIFQRFCKLNNYKEGTGLGLSICLTLAEKMGGEIVLDRTYKEKGARFLFRMPAVVKA